MSYLTHLSFENKHKNQHSVEGLITEVIVRHLVQRIARSPNLVRTETEGGNVTLALSFDVVTSEPLDESSRRVVIVEGAGDAKPA